MTAFSILAASARKRLSEAALLAVSTALSVVAIGVFTAAAASDAVALASAAKQSFAFLFTSASIVTALFAALSGWFFAEHYLSRRKREIATWLLVGMKRRMAFGLLAAEFATASAVAFATGIGLGALLSRFFALALAALMRERTPIPMPFGPRSIEMSALACLFQFLLASLRSAFIVSKVSISTLMRSGREAERPARGRPILAALGGFLIIVSYAGAIFARGPLAILLMIPVLIGTIAGTFLCFSALVPTLAGLARRRKSSIRAAALVASAQISFRSRRNAGLLALTAVLMAVAATASGTVIALNASDASVARRVCPHDIELSAPDAASIAAVEAAISPSRQEAAHPSISEYIAGEIKLQDGNVFTVSVYSESNWASALSLLGEKADAVEERRFRSTQAGIFISTTGKSEEVRLEIGHYSRSFISYPEPCLPPYSVMASPNSLILNDADYRALRSVIPFVAIRGIASWDGIDPEIIRTALPALASIQPKAPRVRIAVLAEQAGLTGAMLFIGIFLAAVFILSSASLLVFRVTEDSRDDADRYRIIMELGASRKTIRDSLILQDLFSFGLPLLFGLAHCSAALVMMSNISGFANAGPTIIVAAASLPVFLLASAAAVDKQLGYSLGRNEA